MQKFVLFFLALFFSTAASAQVERTVVVEHFTNTRCGICSFRNPALFDNLNANPEVLHLSTHPSAPYPTCVLHQHNTVGNDLRVNYYNIWGSTPRIVIQGEVYTQSSSNWDSPELFDDYLNQTSPASIAIQQSKTDENVEAQITIKTEATHDLEDLQLYIVLVEDTIFYEAPNGEDEHYNVFRKNVSEGNGFAMNLPETVGEEVTFNISSEVHADWKVDRIYTMAILQDVNTNEVIQAFAVPASLNEPISSVRDLPQLEGISILPNPTNDILRINLEDNALTNSYLYDLNGQLVLTHSFQNTAELSLADFPKGAYFLKVINENGVAVEKVIKE